MIPDGLKPLFWDVNLDTFNPAAYPEYTSSRVLEWGDREAVDWLKETFPEAQIREVIRTEKRLSPRSANFWALVYGIPEDQVAALH
jgi:hypothetical protein